MDGKCLWCGEDDAAPCEVCGNICERCCNRIDHRREMVYMPKDSVEAWAREVFGEREVAGT